MSEIRSASLPATTQQPDPRATVRKITLRLLPIIFIAYVIAYVDRVNLGFAQLTMGEELGIKAAAYGLAASIFFLAYFVFEVPSNLLLSKFGARNWITRIMVSWGLVTVLTGFATSIEMLYATRFMLGVAEAGFFPGMIYFLTQWYRSSDRAKALGWLIFAQPIAFMLGGFFGGLIVDHVHLFGMSSWRWVFILTGVPAVLMGIVVYRLLPDSPQKAKWLTKSESKWLTDSIDAEQGERTEGVKAQLAALKNPTIIHLSLIHLAFATGSYGFNLFLPLIIKQINPTYSATNIGFTAVVPYIFAAIGILLSARLFDRARNKRLMVASLTLLAAAGLTGAVLLTDHPALAMVAVSVTACAVFSFLAPFWAIVTLRISRTQAAVGVAVVNSVGNLGGFFGPYLVGQGSGGSTVISVLIAPIAAFVLAAILIFFLKQHKHQDANSTTGMKETVR
jgi:ACS family tartrate transporter-like MFS transporter